MRAFAVQSILAVAAMSASATVRAFSALPPLTSQQRTSTMTTTTCLSTDAATTSTSRKGFLQDCTKLVAGVTATTAGVWLPQLAVAAAATTDTTTSKLAASAALRSVKIAKKRLQSETVFDYIVQSDYPALQAVLRVAPISEIRKACFVLVRAADDGEDNSTLLSVQYKAFIAALEKLDTTAMVAIRGRALGASEFRDSYDATVSALSDFVETAEKSVVTISPVTAVAVAAESNAD